MIKKPQDCLGTGDLEYRTAWDKVSQLACPPVIPPEPFYCFGRLDFYKGKVYYGMMDISPMLTPPVLSYI